MDPAPGTVCHTQVTGFSDASLLTVLKQCRKKEYRILTYLLFISNLWLWAPIAWSPWFPMGAGETQFLRHKPTVFSPLPASGLKPSFYLKKKNFFFPQIIRFLSCSFLQCFKTVSRLIFWKEGNLVFSAGCRPGTAKVEKESKGQREKTFSYFTAA